MIDIAEKLIGRLSSLDKVNPLAAFGIVSPIHQFGAVARRNGGFNMMLQIGRDGFCVLENVQRPVDLRRSSCGLSKGYRNLRRA